MAVAIGHDAAYETLSAFIGDPDIQPVTASNPEQLVLALRWATVHVARAASSLTPSGPPPAQIARPWSPATEAEQCGERGRGGFLGGNLAGGVLARVDRVGPRLGSHRRCAEPGCRCLRVVPYSRRQRRLGRRRIRRSRRSALRPIRSGVRGSPPNWPWSARRGAGDEPLAAPGSIVSTAAAKLLPAWREAVLADVQREPFTADELIRSVPRR